MLGPREFHEMMFERSCQPRARPPSAPTLVAHTGAQQSDSEDELDEMLEDEQEIMMEMGGSGPPPPDE